MVPLAIIDPASCVPLSVGSIDTGTNVYREPDTAGDLIVTVSKKTSLCVSRTPEGFGLVRVKLLDGRSGFVSDSDVIQ
jgi:hypothetical protein